MRYSGTQLSALAQVEPYEIGYPCSGGDKLPPIETLAAAANTKPRVRKHRPKGQASGWLETRTGNRKRKRPTISHYYRWDSPQGRVSEYIRASQVRRVAGLIEAERPALEILRVVVDGKRKLSAVSAELLAK